MSCLCKNKRHGASGCSCKNDENHAKIKSLCTWCREGCNKRAESTKDGTVIFLS